MPSDKDTMEGFLSREADAIAGDLEGLNERDLKQARALEAKGKNRGDVIEAIDKQLAEVAGGDKKTTKKTAAKKSAGKAARGEEAPAWQKPDYNGPMTLEISEWRRRNLEQK